MDLKEFVNVEMNDSGIEVEATSPKIPLFKDEASREKIVQKFKEVGHVKDDVYYVEKIVGFRVVHDVMSFKCQWVGWPAKYNSWEPAENVHDCPKLVAEYFISKPKRYELYEKFGQKLEGQLADAQAHLAALNAKYDWGDEDDDQEEVEMAEYEKKLQDMFDEIYEQVDDNDAQSDDSGLGMSPREI